MTARWLRRALQGALLVSAVGPVVVLAVVSIGRDWFFPALVPHALSANAWAALVRGTPLARAVATSVSLAVATGVVAVALALPAGRALARLDGRSRATALALAGLPVAAPPIAIATGLAYALVRAGLGGSWTGVLLGHLVPAVGILALYFRGAFTAVDPGIEDEARSLGAGALQLWTRVLVPMLRGPIAGGWALGFLLSWAQVPLTLLIGGGRVHTLPLEVFGYIRAGSDRFAAVGALLLCLPPMLALMLVVSRPASAR